MKFLRGEKDKLQGRAVIFMDLRQPGDFGEEAGKMNALAVFCAVSELDLLELIAQVMHLPREHSRLITRFYKRYFQEIEKIKRDFPAKISRIIDEIVADEEDEVNQPIIDSFRRMFKNETAKNQGEDEESGQPGQKLPQPEFYSTMIPLPARDYLEAYAVYQPENDIGFDIIDLEREEMLEVAHQVLRADYF